MEKIIHRSDSRGIADHGWLFSRHTFSFANYYHAGRMGFGKLRVLNDDLVDAGAGFDTHGHDNMEIVSIPLHGALRHQDSMGNHHIIKPGEVQIMSAGSGLTHSEFNDSDFEPVNFLQIWILPKQRDITPRYGQQHFARADRENRFQLVVSPQETANSVWINQDAYFSLGDFKQGQQGAYQLHGKDNGVYVLVIDGQVSLADEQLAKRDAIGLTGVSDFVVQANADCQLLVIEVPMS